MRDISGKAAHLLGGTRIFHKRRMVPLDWIDAVRRGFPVLAVDAFGRNINATNAELAQILGVSPRALALRRTKGSLTPAESGRLFRVVKVVVRAEDVFGKLATGVAWLKAANISLGGVAPISLLDTETGAELVTNILSRIEYGIVV